MNTDLATQLGLSDRALLALATPVGLLRGITEFSLALATLSGLTGLCQRNLVRSRSRSRTHKNAVSGRRIVPWNCSAASPRRIG